MDSSYFLVLYCTEKVKPILASLLHKLKWLSLMTTFKVKVCRKIQLILTDDLRIAIIYTKLNKVRPSVSSPVID